MTDREKFEEFMAREGKPTAFVEQQYWRVWQAALASQQPEKSVEVNDGWIEWEGGDCPVAAGTLVDIRCRDGSQENGLRACFPEWERSKSATSTWWYRDNSPGDIIAYRVVKL